MILNSYSGFKIWSFRNTWPTTLSMVTLFSMTVRGMEKWKSLLVALMHMLYNIIIGWK
jgi:hypothetical protein